jgi:D-aspartate ligase
MGRMQAKTCNLIPAVVLSCHTMGLGVIRELGQKGVPVIAVYYDKNDMGYVSKYVSERIYTPHPERDEKQFISLLIQIAQRHGQCVLIPADDPTLLIVAQNKRLLQNYFIVACPDENITRKIIDKKYTYALAEKIGIPSPKTLIPKTSEDVKNYCEKIQFPCIVKPNQSHKYFEVFRKKMCKVENENELFSAYQEAQNAGIDVMIQEYIPGDDTCGINYNSYFWNNESVVHFTAQKVRLSPIGFGVPSVVRSRDKIPEVVECADKLLKSFGYSGYSCMEFKKDSRDNIYKLMEINGRFNRSILLSSRCNLNFSWIMYNHLTKGELQRDGNYQKNIYWIDEVRDLLTSNRQTSNLWISFWNFFPPYINKNVFALFDCKDIRPVIQRFFNLFQTGLQNIFTRFRVSPVLKK